MANKKSDFWYKCKFGIEISEFLEMILIWYFLMPSISDAECLWNRHKIITFYSDSLG